jgi:hypothetical protein
MAEGRLPGAAGGLVVAVELCGCHQPPLPARFARHPLPQGARGRLVRLTPSPAQGEGWLSLHVLMSVPQIPSFNLAVFLAKSFGLCGGSLA